MNRKIFYLILIIYSFALRLSAQEQSQQVPPQYYSSTATNAVTNFNYFEFSGKGSLGYAFPIINEQRNNGVNGSLGIITHYYFHPIFAIETGLGIEGTWAIKNITEKELVNEGNNLGSKDIDYNYAYTFLNVKIPFGLVLNLSNFNKGFLFGCGLNTIMGIDGRLKITRDNTDFVNYEAYTYDTDKKIYSNKFKRLGLQIYFNASYRTGGRMSLGTEMAFGLSDMLNDQVVAAYSNYWSVYLIYSLKKNN